MIWAWIVELTGASGSEVIGGEGREVGEDAGPLDSGFGALLGMGGEFKFDEAFFERWDG